MACGSRARKCMTGAAIVIIGRGSARTSTAYHLPARAPADPTPRLTRHGISSILLPCSLIALLAAGGASWIVPKTYMQQVGGEVAIVHDIGVHAIGTRTSGCKRLS
jgi:hypothetical protein